MGQIKFKNINKQTDNIIGVEYDSARINAMELSNYLKDNLKSKSIDYNIFNSDRLTKNNAHEYEKMDKAVIKNPPREIYEYQNFFLLKRGSEYILMDGFRRLLWYTVPDIDVNVRIYDGTKLTNKDMLSLMVNLNHFKFFSGSAYHDRGFGLFLRSIFGLTISNYIGALDGYLSYNKTKRDWSLYESIDGNTKNASIKERIVNDHFIDDMAFIEQVTKQGAMMNRFVGSLIYSVRTSTDVIFDAAKFMKIHKETAALQPLISRYGIVGLTRGAESEKVTNQILEIYGNTMTVMLGGKVIKSYAEQLADCKELTEQMKKDKNLIKLTNSGYGQELELIIKQKIEAGEKVEFKCVVYPIDEKSPILESGLNENVKFTNWQITRYKGTKDVKSTLPVFGILDGKHIFKTKHNTGFSNYQSHITKRWAKLRQYDKDGGETYHGEQHDIELFVVMPQSVLKELKNAK